MNNRANENIIKTFHSVAQMRPEKIFVENPLLIVTHQEECGYTASSGWVGNKYAKGGTIFMGINPGGGTSTNSNSNPDDVLLYKLLNSFKAARGESEIITTFVQLNSSWIELQKRHSIGKVLISKLLEALNLDIHQTAFLNIVPFRTFDNKPPPRDAVERAWSLASQKQVDALQPKRIFLLGNKAFDAMNKIGFSSGIIYERVQRTNGDRYLSDQAKALCEKLKRSRSENPK